jgi:hypothetical protein
MIRFNDAQVRSLESLLNAWGQERVVLVGAGAVQCHMEMTWRVTADVDIVVGVDLAEFHDLLEGISGWQLNPRLEHRIVSPWNIKVDVVPAGPSLRAAGKVVWPRSQHEMQLVGMDLAFKHAVNEPLGNTSLQVASLPTIVILKMNSWLDNSTERERDLADISHILEEAVRRGCVEGDGDEDDGGILGAVGKAENPVAAGRVIGIERYGHGVPFSWRRMRRFVQRCVHTQFIMDRPRNPASFWNVHTACGCE